MLAPIITKDMKLFPSRPLPTNLKNVRSRAQSLDQVSALQNATTMHGRVVPVRPRNSQSTGNLPAVARSPPGTNRKSTLAAIQEGVEMSDRKDDPTTSSPALDVAVMNGISLPVKKMTPSQAAKIDAVKKSKLSTGSSSDSASDDGGERKENNKSGDNFSRKSIHNIELAFAYSPACFSHRFLLLIIISCCDHILWAVLLTSDALSATLLPREYN